MHKVSNCEYCGDDLGYTEEKFYGDEMIVCGKAECLKEARYQANLADEEARERAEQDNYGYYR